MPPDPTFDFDGAPVPLRPGQSVGAALWAAGVRSWRTTSSGARRGLYCGIGACWDCLAGVDGVASQRACQVTARPGMVVRSAPTPAPTTEPGPEPDPGPDPEPDPEPAPEPAPAPGRAPVAGRRPAVMASRGDAGPAGARRCDIAVVGAGP